MYSENKQAIEKFFSELRELNERLMQKDWGECSNIYYNLECGHLRRRTWESHPVALRAIEIASQILCDPTLLTMEQRNAKIELNRHGDSETRDQWEKTHDRLNRERCAQLVLKAMHSVEVPPIPEPSPEAMERSRAAWGHQIGDKVIPPGVRILQGPIDLPSGKRVIYGVTATPVREEDLPAGSAILDLTDGEGPVRRKITPQDWVDYSDGKKPRHAAKNWVENLPEERPPGSTLDLSKAARALCQIIDDELKKQK